MAETNKIADDFRKTNGLDKGSVDALLAYKKALGESISKSPEILKGRSSSEEIVHTAPSRPEASDPLDGAFLSALDNYVFDDSEPALLHGQSDLLKEFNKLPQNLQDVIKTGHALFTEVPPSSDKQEKQQITTLKIAEKVLSTGDKNEEHSFDDGELKIDAKTSRALRNYLEDLQEPDGPKLKQEFEPRVFDNNAKKALDELVKLRAEEVGINANSTEIKNLMVHLINMEQHNGTLLFAGASDEDKAQIQALGKAITMRNLMNLIVTGQTPSGAKGTPARAEVTWDKPWTNDDSRDLFFSERVYKTLHKEKPPYDEGPLTTDVLFNKSGYSKDQHDILKEAAKKALDIDPDGPNYVISEMQVGQIAIEIMKIRAEQVWCIDHEGEFDPKQVHAMIHNKEFMPHRYDLKLVDAGFGVPSDEYIDVNTGDFATEDTLDKYKKSLQEVASDMKTDSWRLEYEFEHVVRLHRIAKFQETFGDMTKDALDNNTQVLDPALVNERKGTPSLYYNSYGSIVGKPWKTAQYDIDRDVYLKRVQAVIEDDACDPSSGCKGCKSTGDKSPDNGCTVEGEYEERLREDFNNAAPPKEETTDKCTVEGEYEKILSGEFEDTTTEPEETADAIIKANRNDIDGKCTIEDQPIDAFLYKGKRVLTLEETAEAVKSLGAP